VLSASRRHTANCELNGCDSHAGKPGLNGQIDHLGPHAFSVRMSVNSEHSLHNVGIMRSSVYRHASLKSKWGAAIEIALSDQSRARVGPLPFDAYVG
jgi:hypothetical protein